MKAMSMTKAARELKMSAATLKALTDAGKVPAWFVTDSGRYVYSEETILEHQRIAAHRGAA